MDFKEKIVIARNIKYDRYKEIISFSKDLMKVMKLTEEDVKEANSLENIRWDFEEFSTQFSILPVSRPFLKHGWVSLLECIPLSVDKEFGYKNTSSIVPKGWHYEMHSTATEILPPENLRKQILKYLKKL